MRGFKSSLAVGAAALLISACGDSGGVTDAAATDVSHADAVVASDAAVNAADSENSPREVAGPDVGGGSNADVARDLAMEPAPTDDGPSAGEAGPVDGGIDGTRCNGWTKMVHMQPGDAAKLLAESHPIVINVHTPYAGDIPGTDTDIPFDQVDKIENYLKHDHCADVLLVCLGGGMSTMAGDELVRRGYLRIRDIDGGMFAWEGAGYPLLKDGGT